MFYVNIKVNGLAVIISLKKTRNKNDVLLLYWDGTELENHFMRDDGLDNKFHSSLLPSMERKRSLSLFCSRPLQTHVLATLQVHPE